MRSRKPSKLLAIVLAGAMLAIGVPWVPAEAQPGSVGTVRLSSTRGTGEILQNGRWRPISGSIQGGVGTTVRARAGSEVTFTLDDGSALRLDEAGAVRIVEISAHNLHLKAIGQVEGNLSPAVVAGNTVGLEFPVGRATINKDMAAARSISPATAASQARFTAQTPTAQVLRVVVLQGSATVQANNNVKGTVTEVHPDSGTITLREASSGRQRLVTFSDATLVARPDHSSSRQSLSVASKVSLIQVGQQLTVYGLGTPGALGGGMGAFNRQQVAQGPPFQGVIVIGPDGVFINGELFVQAPSVPTEGNGSATSPGNTLVLNNGDLVVSIVPGTDLLAICNSLEEAIAEGAAGGGGNSLITILAIIAAIIAATHINNASQ